MQLVLRLQLCEFQVVIARLFELACLHVGMREKLINLGDVSILSCFLEELERDYIAEILDYTRGKKSKAATILGITRKTLLEKRKKYGL